MKVVNKSINLNQNFEDKLNNFSISARKNNHNGDQLSQLSLLNSKGSLKKEHLTCFPNKLVQVPHLDSQASFPAKNLKA